MTVPLLVAGASGMLAGELLRLVELHPGVHLAGAFSRTETRLADVHPHCPGDVVTRPNEALGDALQEALAEGERAALVLALPHGSSVETFVALRERLGADVERVAVVDLAADFRLRDPQRYRAAYGSAHAAPGELAGFAYGLVEHRREEIARARRVAAPGCFATAMQLAVVPAARAGLLDAKRAWVLDGVTGSSGSGRDPKPTTHHPHRHGNLWAYALDGHRHEAELAQALDELGVAAPLHFVPHSGPFARGIHLTAHLPLARATDADTARAAYADLYADQPFVEVLPEGVPDLRRVVGSNRAALAVHVRGEVLTVLLTLDNLIKGGAGQGLQCLNLMLDMPETWGLPRYGLGVA